MRRRSPGLSRVAIVRRHTSGEPKMSDSVLTGPSTVWRMPEATRRPLTRVRWTMTAPVPSAPNSSASSGLSRAAAVRGSGPRSGSASFATSSDCTTTRNELSIDSTS
jgi:hypothetical protein